MTKTFYVLTTVLSLLSFKSSAMDGGQSTNGGNGCWVSESTGSTKWLSIEEILYSDILLKEQHFTQTLQLPLRKNEDFNLFDHYLSHKMFSRLERLKYLAPETFKVLKETTRLFENVRVLPYSIAGVYGADLGDYLPRCSLYAPALLTTKEGAIVFFQKTWNKLHPRSAQIILIHETIRLAQLFHPAFKNLSNHRLQRLSALLFSDSRMGFDLRNELKEIEKNLWRKEYEIPEVPFPEVGQDGSFDAQAAFRSVFHNALRNNVSFADAVNQLKEENVFYKQSVKLNFRKRHYH